MAEKGTRTVEEQIRARVIDDEQVNHELHDLHGGDVLLPLGEDVGHDRQRGENFVKPEKDAPRSYVRPQ